MDKRLRNLPALRCFDAATRHQSYSKAADELAITQAAVSQQIRGLEQSLGVKLFVRDGRTMQLTDRGQILAKYVQQALGTLIEGFNKILCEPKEGVLTVTTAMSFASMWLMPRLWRFSLANPGISIRVMASAKREDLRNSEIDVAIRQGNSVDDRVHQETLLQDPVYPVCSPQLIEDVGLTSPQQVTRCWLLEGLNPDIFSWQNWFDIAGVDANAASMKWMEVETWEMGINAVMAGHGISLAANCMASAMLEKGLLVKPFDISIEPGLKFSLLFDPDSPRMSRIEAFRSWLKSELATEHSHRYSHRDV